MVDVLLGTVMKILLCRFDQIILILLELLIQHKLIPSLVDKHANLIKPKINRARPRLDHLLYHITDQLIDT